VAESQPTWSAQERGREGIVHNGSHKPYAELGELARFVEHTIRALSQASEPLASTSASLPAATSHLNDLNKMTEDGTLEVMRLTEMIQDNRGRTRKELGAIIETLEAGDCTTLAKRLQMAGNGLAQDDKLLTEIMTALSFQDLVAQRVKKLGGILNDVQDKLMELVVVFGIQEDVNGDAVTGKTGELLKQLEASKTTAVKQNVADEILAQFGFKSA
jgi:chemotaxis protein CheZ